MKVSNGNKICPLPWVHLSGHLDSTMRICCNTDGPGFVTDDSGNLVKFNDIKNIDEYFNLNFFKEIRAKMVNGEEPEICRKCFEVEHHGGMSVRQGYMQGYAQDKKFLQSLAETNPESGEIKPVVQSLDLSLSNLCNLKCIMCSPSASYIIKADYDKLNLDYSAEFTEGARKNWKDITAFKTIIPQIAPSMKEFLTTGGEPFLNPEHLAILEIIVSSGNASNITLSYHTNCTVWNEKLFKLWENFKSISVHFSVDAYGPLNEYVRYKTRWKDVERNVREIVKLPRTHCEVHSTIQALNIFGLTDLYKWIGSVPKIPKLPFHIWMDQPDWLRVDVLPPEYIQLALDKINANVTTNGVHETQIRSYLKRAMSEYQGEEKTRVFVDMVRRFENLRKNPPIESLVPELAPLFLEK